MILQIILAFIGTMGFSIIFNVPRKELLLCGLTGAASWSVYRLIFDISSDFVVAAILFAAITVTCISRMLSFARKMPVTIYLIPGIIPLVPGAGLYYTMLHAVMGESTRAMIQGIETLRNAGVIAVGLLITLSLPPKLFSFISLIKKK